MKKKLLTLALITAMALSMVACGSKSETPNNSEVKKEEPQKKEEPKEPTNLSGTWQSENNDGSYQEAVITEDSMEIYWISDDGDTKSLFWAGTYISPTEYVEEYEWTSDNDTEKTDSALLASTEESKKFTYKNETISYEVSALGITTTMELTRK